MSVAILSAAPPDMSAYVSEILHTWGLVSDKMIGLEALSTLDPAETPVLVCGMSAVGGRDDTDIITYAERGGSVICFLPSEGLRRAAAIN